MSKHIVSKSFKAVRPGEVYPSTIEEGEEVDGRLAEIGKELKALKAAPKKKANGPASGGNAGTGGSGTGDAGGDSSNTDDAGTGTSTGTAEAGA